MKEKERKMEEEEEKRRIEERKLESIGPY